MPKTLEAALTPETLNLKRDILRGAQAIADFRGEALDRTRYLIRKKLIPTYREGGIICASKRVLVAHHMKQAVADAQPAGTEAA
jgi:hypothetical protein